MKKDRKTINNKNNLKILIVPLFISICIVLLDYHNILFKNGIMISNLNLEFWNIFINSVIVVVLYIATYFLIDRKNVIQSENKNNIAKQILENSYSSCIENIDWMSRKGFRQQIAKKVNGTENWSENKIYQKLIEEPFENNEMIFSFAKEGIINSIQLNDYLKIKKDFRQFIIMSIVFHDKFELAEDSKKKLEKSIELARKNIIK